jgi:hypothetical protein
MYTIAGRAGCPGPPISEWGRIPLYIGKSVKFVPHRGGRP